MNINFYNSKDSCQLGYFDCLIVNIPPVDSKNKLLTELSKGLSFPDYFGFNWDALYDLLCSCYGIEEKNIAVFHEGIKELPARDLFKYLDIIKATCEWWKEHVEHHIMFFFNSKEKDYLTGFDKCGTGLLGNLFQT